MKIALTFNLKRRAEGQPEDFCSEFDSIDTVNSIKKALESGGHKVTLVEANNSFYEWMVKNNPDFVFNIAEGINGGSREAQVPAILDFLKIPYTGSGVLALSVALNKAMTKKIFIHEGIPTPRFQAFASGKEELSPELEFPLIVKPNAEGSAKGISSKSVVGNKKELYEAIGNCIVDYSQEVIVEEFIDGRELTVAVLGNNPPMALSPLEIRFDTCKAQGEYFYSWRVKEYQGSPGFVPDFICPAKLEPNLLKDIEQVVLKAHIATGCLDVSRTDIRLAKDGTPYVLEINPLPGLDPLESNLTHITNACGIKYVDLINTILQNAITRYNGKPKQGGKVGTRELAAH